MKATLNLWVERGAVVAPDLGLRELESPNINGEVLFLKSPIQIRYSSDDDRCYFK